MHFLPGWHILGGRNRQLHSMWRWQVQHCRRNSFVLMRDVCGGHFLDSLRVGWHRDAESRCGHIKLLHELRPGLLLDWLSGLLYGLPCRHVLNQRRHEPGHIIDLHAMPARHILHQCFWLPFDCVWRFVSCRHVFPSWRCLFVGVHAVPRGFVLAAGHRHNSGLLSVPGRLLLAAWLRHDSNMLSLPGR